MTYARCRPASAALALLGRGPADRLNEKRADTAFGVITRHPRQSAVHHVADTIDGDRSFRNVGGDDHFAQRMGGEGQVLLFG